MIDFKQSSFQGGINQQLDATKIPDLGNSYFLGVNIRNREDVLQTIPAPLDLSSTHPVGNLQGIYGAGTFLLLFINGRAYFRNVGDAASNNFTLLTDSPQFDANVPYIYAEFIPASSVGYARLKIPGSQDVELDLEQDWPFISSLQGVIYSDGINQPALILENSFDVQITNTFAQWNSENREYVPKMKQMLYYSGKLFGASADGKELYQSVSGKPLDFIIPVNDEGDKVSNVEIEGGASATSARVDFESITAIRPVPNENTLIIGAGNKTFLGLIDDSVTQFSEPFIRVFPVAAVGPVNHFCFVDLLGDTAFITPHGIDSVNSASILKQESTNSPVSGIISNLFQTGPTSFVSQDYPCASQFGADFALFAVNTIYGRGVLIFDRTTQKFISLDLYAGVAQIKMFAQVLVNGQRRLFFITTDNKLYEAFAGATQETAGVLIGEWCSNDPKISQKPIFLHLVFTECEQAGNVTITPYINRQAQESKVQALAQKINPASYPITPPFQSSSQDSTQVVSFNLTGTVKAGWKIGFYIQWNVKAKLTHINLTSESQNFDVNQQAKPGRYVSLSV